MSKMPRRARAVQNATRAGALKAVFGSPLYIGMAVLFTALYYLFFYYLIVFSDKGIFLVTVPIGLVYALVVSASVLLTVSVYAIGRSIHARYAGAEGSALSIATSALNGIIVGCNCYAPILSSALYALGFGTLGVSSAISFLGDFSTELLVVFIVVNLAFLYYQLGRISRISRSGVH